MEELDPKYIEHTFSRKKSSEPFKNSLSKSSSQPLKNKFSKPLAHLKKVSNTDNSANYNKEQDILKIKIGDQVVHERFGKGKVVEINGEFPNTKATVFFPSSGQKQLLNLQTSIDLILIVLFLLIGWRHLT